MSRRNRISRKEGARTAADQRMQTSTSTFRILLIEDDWDVAQTVQDGLRSTGFSLTHGIDIASARKSLAAAGGFDAVVLDLTLPDGDGLAFAAELRAGGCDIPILMLTARDSVADRLAGFEHGADDYLGKPFDVNELTARLRAMIKRAKQGERHILRYADLELNLLTRRVRRPELEAIVSDREAELLALMIRHAEEVLTREEILDELWGEGVDETSNLVNVYVNLLRNKIETPRHASLIHTVRGVGYLFSTRDPIELNQ